MDIKTTIDHYLNLFKAHERLILLLAAGFFAVHFYSKGIDYLTQRDKTEAQIAASIAQTAAQKVNTDDKQNQLLIAQLNQLQQTVNQQKKTLDAAIAARAAATTTQKSIDASATLSGVADRLKQILPSVADGINVQPGIGNSEGTGSAGYLRVEETAAHQIVGDEEDVLQLRGDIQDIRTELIGCQSVGAKQQDVITGLNTQIADGKIALQTEQISHTKDIKELKDKNHNSWLKGFKWGVITGLIGGEAIRIVIHKP